MGMVPPRPLRFSPLIMVLSCRDGHRTEATGSIRRPHPEPRQARQHLLTEIRQLVEIVDEREGDAAHAGFADAGELVRHAVRRPHERIAADRIARKVLAFLGVLLGWNRLRRDVLVRKHAVDRTPIGVLDDGVAIVILRLRLGGATDHLADGVDLDLAAEISRRASRWVTPNISNSPSFQPTTRLTPKRPWPTWSAVTNSLAAISGWNSGACTVPNTVMRWVAERRPTAQVTVSSVLP